MSFVGGKLKLKGGEPLKGSVKKKKKKSSGSELALASSLQEQDPAGADGEGKAKAAEPIKTKDGFILPDPPKEADRRTEAEKKHAAHVAKLEEEKLRKQATKGYRDRVKDFNEHLASLSEHHDIPKVSALALIFLGSTINYTILQSVRDAIIVTSCGAEALPFITAFGVLPASFLFFMYYDKLGKLVNSSAVFYLALAPMAIFYALFAAVLLPNAAVLHPVALAEQYMAVLPASLSCFVCVAANWSYTLFFILGELYGSVAISLLFWSLADDVCSVEEAREVYPKLGILANVGLIAAGSFTRFVTEGLAKGNEVLSLQILVGAILVMTAMMCGVKAYVDAHVLPYVEAGHKKKDKKKDKKKEEPKEKQDTWQVLRSSPRILNLVLLVMGYGTAHKLFGFVWKGQMKVLYPSTAEFATVMADVASFTGAATVSLMLVSKYIFQYLGWRGAALMTPLVCLAAGAVFFAGSLFPPGSLPASGPLAALLALGPIAGIMVQVFGRAAKYSLFDPSKEMVFITMDKEQKAAGKAAVDILGNQIGKSSGSWIMQAALLGFGSMAAALPFTSLVYLLVCGVWLNATLSLARTMEEQEQEKTVLASIDDTPFLQGVAPGKLLLPAAAAGGGAVLLPVPANQAEVDRMNKEVKESMQSHFD
uniref:ADP,ATP carrier protein n=1 Tax=Tetradesmus obliquus TaxID=3088 RepID=A0A383WNC7_TETOB|eukprot:jgi/Sobl393_1/13828/SZX78947.1